MIPWPDFLSADARIDFWTIVVGIACNASCAILGCFLVLRRMSLLGDAVSHSVLAGIAIAFLLAGTTAVVPMFFGALIAGVLTAFLTQTLSGLGRVSEDASMGIVFTSLFAVGVILISQMGRVHLDTECVLFGRLDTVSLETSTLWGVIFPQALVMLIPVFVMVLLFVSVFWKELKIVSFDPQLATAMGISAMIVHYLLMTMVAATTVAALHSVGAIVVVAMLIVPAATAHLLTDRLLPMVTTAVLCGTSAAIFGCLWARQVNSNAAGLMATVAGLQFGVVVFLAPRHGLLSRLVNNIRLALRIVSEDIIASLYRREESPDRPTDHPTEREPNRKSFSPQPLDVSARTPRERFLTGTALFLMRRRGELERSSAGTVQLTASGRRVGLSLVRSHRLWEAYLDENFDLPADHLHEPAAQIEHFIGPALQDRLAESLERPETDPHGRSIPTKSEEESG